MIILYIRKFFDCCVKFFFCTIIMLLNKIIFQCIKISFHRSIIIWISSLTHALSDTKCSDIDFAIYDKIRNIILVIEAKWIDKHYSDEIDKRYGMIFKTLNGIFTKQIKKHREFLSQRENIDFIFEDDERYIRSEMEPQIYYLAVDKRNQMHIDEMHMISDYMMIYFLKKYSKNHELNLLDLWKEISSLKTKFEYMRMWNFFCK